MKVSKAIEVNKDTLYQYEKHLLSDQRDALKLGIEALKQLHANRHSAWPSKIGILLGETPEEEVVHD